MNIFLKSLTYVATFGAGVVAGGLAVQKYFEKRLLGNMEMAKKMLGQLNGQPGNMPMEGNGQELNVISQAPVAPQSNVVVNPQQRANIAPLNITAESLGHKTLSI